jgi:hypothetical protein
MNEKERAGKPGRGGHYCVSGRHFWTDKSDADRCCHPDWQRHLLVGADAIYGVDGDSKRASDVPVQPLCGSVFGRRWVHRSDPAFGR